MEAVLVMIIFILVMAIIISLHKVKELSLQEKLRDLVAWSVSQDDHIRCNIPLFSYVANAQINLDIPKEYRISGDEGWGFVKEILAEYQTDLIQSFFSRCLTPKVLSGKYVPRGQDYFMLMLYIFLSEHQCDRKFADHDMRGEQLEYKQHGHWGGPLYDSKYTLSDFAIVYHKMHYITYMYCRGNDAINGFVPEWCEEGLKQILDTNQIEISRR